MVSPRLDNCSPALRACWHPVALAEHIDEGPIRVRLLGSSWVVARVDGALVGFEDRCPHRGAPLSAGTLCGATLRCAYHGWAFDRDGVYVDIPALGDAATVPPRAHLDPVRVVEHGGLVWLAPADPVVGLPELPVGDRWSFLVSDWAASAAHMLDNFLDVGHFAFSHARSFGVREDARSVDMEVERDGWVVTVRHRHLARLVDSAEWADGAAPPVPRTQTFRYEAPFSLRLDIVYDDEPDEVTLWFVVQPVDRTHSRLYSTAVRNPAAAARCDAVVAAERGQMIIDEDRRVLEAVAEFELDLDPVAELHTRADRNTVALRRVLSDLVHVAERADVAV